MYLCTGQLVTEYVTYPSASFSTPLSYAAFCRRQRMPSYILTYRALGSLARRSHVTATVAELFFLSFFSLSTDTPRADSCDSDCCQTSAPAAQIPGRAPQQSSRNAPQPHWCSVYLLYWYKTTQNDASTDELLRAAQPMTLTVSATPPTQTNSNAC